MVTHRIFRLEPFARAGFAARGVVYLALGYLVLHSQHGKDPADVLERLRAVPAGAFIMVALALGLFGYGLWRIVGAVLDLDDDGRSVVGIATRIGLAVSGLTHWALCALAIIIAMPGGRAPDGGEEQAARTAFEYPGGALLVGLVGAAIAIGGVGQWVIGFRAGFMKFLQVRQPRFARFAGRAGYFARGGVMVVLGWQVITLAVGWGGRQLGMDGALDIIARREWVFPFVAGGLFLFGLFSLMVAMWLRIRDEDVDRRVKLAGRRLGR
jgi:Domain of Unknown Function (DUF1206)